MPIIAEAYYKQISSYFAQHAEVELTSGQICYEAAAAEELAGKYIALAKKVDSCKKEVQSAKINRVFDNNSIAFAPFYTLKDTRKSKEAQDKKTAV